MRRALSFIHTRLFKELVLFGGIVAFLIAAAILLWVSTLTLPDLHAFSGLKTLQSTRIYDRTGKVLLYDFGQGIRRTEVPDNEISRNIKNATVAIEDSDFYDHPGVRFTSIIRAAIADIIGGSYAQGGSTITQQVIKMSLLNSQKSITRKIKEVILALKLEQVMSKDDILDIYLNEAPYGGTLYGVEEASEAYFGKKASDVDLAEAAYLAALPNAPTYYSPYGNHKDALEARKNLVLQRMLDKHFITQSEFDKAKTEQVVWQPEENVGIKAPHFVMFIRQYLEDTYGADAVSGGGLKVITTLDYGLQQKAEQLAKQYAAYNLKNFDAENLALVAIDPKTGQILAMVGSRDYFDKTIDGNFNVALAHRQPGSVFKPIVYAEAFNKGYTPDTVVFDLPTEFDTNCNPDGTPIIAGNESKCYMPVNYDGKYLGPVSFRDALAQSRNIPSIQVLYLAGLRDSLKLAKDMGITTLTNVDQYGLTLVLGGGEVSPLEMTSAYSVFANDGVRNPYTGILEIDDKDGTVLESYTPHPVQVLPPASAEMINDILSDETARVPEFGSHSALYVAGRPVADKTGTTNDYRDAWIIGYTPNLAVGAWAGNNDDHPMKKKIAGFIVAPFWNAFISEALQQYPVENFIKPPAIDKSTEKPVLAGFWQGNQSYFINKLSGELATPLTPPGLREERVVTDVHSILYWVDRNNPTGPPPADPNQDPQFNLWEYAVQKWVKAQGIVNQTSAVIPTTLDSMHRPELAPKITIQNPTPDLPYDKNSRVTVTVSTTSSFPIARIDYFVNDVFVGTSGNYPWGFSFVPSALDSLRSTNRIRAVAYDTVGNRGEAVGTFRVTL